MKSAKYIGMCLILMMTAQLAHSCAPTGYTNYSPRDYSPAEDLRSLGSDIPDYRSGAKNTNEAKNVATITPQQKPEKPQPNILRQKSSSYITNAIVKGQDPALRYKSVIQKLAARYRIDPHLMLAIVQAESSGNTMAISSVGCRGLTQLHIATARDYSPSVSLGELHDPLINLQIASRHMNNLKHQVRKVFPNANLEQRVLLLAAAWNAGWGRVRRSGGVPRITETQVYTSRVLNLYRKYKLNLN